MNPSSIKKVSQVVVGFGLLFATALAFQNCSGYQMYDAQAQADLSSSCGQNCNQTIAGLTLKLTNTRLSLLDAELPVSNRVVDIGGYCDDAEFADSDIQYQFVDGSTPGPWVSKGVKCDENGRFHIAVDVPTVGASRSYLLQVRLAIPVGTNSYLLTPAAQKSLSIDVIK